MQTFHEKCEVIEIGIAREDAQGEWHLEKEQVCSKDVESFIKKMK